ncbi:programmed cell death protein 7 [Echinops telfairi]|uniref:Programmed cell death protein 7 n=1 Tax=Echinops telfairi TaxID=9371 RepID=A0AC55CN04_ECHTE|nr:programmed cell death protein 7 [Echinops telfairi]
MALPPFYAPGRPGPPPPAPFGCPPPPLPSSAFPPPLPQRPGPFSGSSAPFLQPPMPLETRAPGELQRVQRRRLRLRERAREREAAREAEAARAVEREQEIDRWRVKCVQEVEEKKREQELKAAADGVLSEVRKKQADTKRMVDLLRALEKLRKLRKEAAARKGVSPPASADETFEHHLQRLRKLIKKRSELYEAEERALQVMLEGEQEEERKRELEKKERKEKEKLLLQKREIESKLFGEQDEFPLAHFLQPFRQYYLQAEHSLPALIQIRFCPQVSCPGNCSLPLLRNSWLSCREGEDSSDPQPRNFTSSWQA